MQAVKLADVTVAVVCGVTKLGHELAAFLVLESAGRLREVGGGRADASTVTIDGDGNVWVKDAPPLDDVASTRALRNLLESLLQHTAASTAKLRLCACRPEETGMALLVRELEGALAPLDRTAMRAGAAALARATWEAVADGTFVPDEAPVAVDWSIKETRRAEPEPDAGPISFAVTVVKTPAPMTPETKPAKFEIDVPVTQTLAQSPRPTAALPAVFTETLQSPRTPEPAKKAEPSIAPELALTEEAVALRGEVARLTSALAEAATDRDRRLALLEKDRDRRVTAVEVDRARRVQEAEDERDRRVRDAEAERDRRVRDLEQELAKKRQEREGERLESESLRAKQIEEAAAKVRGVAEGARDRAIDGLKATHEAALLALHTEHQMERKALKERVDELEYALARANTERDAERTLRVDGEVAAANRYRELRRNMPGKAAPDEPRALGYRDVEQPATSDRKWWK